METLVTALEAAWRARDGTFPGVVQELLGRSDALSARERDAALSSLGRLITGDDPRLAAHAALVGGALIEHGASAAALVELIEEPLERWLAQAVDEAEAMLEAAEEDEAALDAPGPALASLDVWYRPAVAAWTRAPDRLRRSAARPGLRRALDELWQGSTGAFWMWLLMSATRGERFVVLVPANRTAYAMTLDGVVDVGQLTVLASHALREAFAAIGAPAADPSVLATMRGDGAQRGHGHYEGNVHFHAWQAIDPATGEPVDGRFRWTAPGGSGDHSLPADFLPTAITPLEGHRVLTLVGPRATAAGFARILGAVRTFGALRAEITDVEALGRAGYDRWLEVVRAQAQAMR